MGGLDERSNRRGHRPLGRGVDAAMKLRTLVQPVLLKSPRKAKKAREIQALQVANGISQLIAMMRAIAEERS